MILVGGFIWVIFLWFLCRVSATVTILALFDNHIRGWTFILSLMLTLGLLYFSLYRTIWWIAYVWNTFFI